jgi:hypothetical protein
MSDRMASRARAAIGFSVHTGWAAAVAVGGPAEAPEVLARARLELLREEDGVVRFVFHSVEKKPLGEARAVVERALFAGARMKKVIDGMGKALGPPWGADQKEAMALAWLALSAGIA